ncbi:hypothetical protein PT974_03618 [Cladobotryum mycophilum]|uniref:RRM domain-containing protein n=1 Tax=Cladobotryum mycophilum TaxID=491253 RepID=A0ABR0SU41_9HYPO
MLAETVSRTSATPIKSSMADGEDFVRLHITPLDADLITSVIPASVLPVARNISYHTIETFPEKRYGFVDLPQAEADKLKKKFQGVTFKGSKMRIEKARPEERIEPTGKEDELEQKKRKSKEDGKEKSKKRKREVDVLDGVALKDRKVKRGWTEAPAEYKKKKSKKDKDSKDKEKEKRKRPKSKYTEDEECLLKMKLPPNAMKNVAPENLPVKKKKKGSSRQVTVHEFEKTTKFPSFLKQSAGTDAKRATEFVEGKGWVDEEGNVVEAVKEKPERPKTKKLAPPPKPVVVEEEDDDDTSSSGTSPDDTSSEEEDSDEEVVTPTPGKPKSAKEPEKTEAKDDSESDSESETSSSGSSSDAESSPSSPQQATPVSSKKTSPSKLAIHIPPPETPSPSKVHPLEALYKRSKPEDNATQTPAPKEAFSFFGGGGDGDAEDEEDEAADVVSSIPMPMTPFTRQDLEWRGTRSAAPTPDTAHPSRMQRLWPMGTLGEDEPEEEQEQEEDEEDEKEDDEEGEGPAQANSDFQKWFWENRRDLNRSWMSRRKTAAKEKRHRENKARASKAV